MIFKHSKLYLVISLQYNCCKVWGFCGCLQKFSPWIYLGSVVSCGGNSEQSVKVFPAKIFFPLICELVFFRKTFLLYGTYFLQFKKALMNTYTDTHNVMLKAVQGRDVSAMAVLCRNQRLFLHMFRSCHRVQSTCVPLNFSWGWGSYGLHITQLPSTYEPCPQQKFCSTVFKHDDAIEIIQSLISTRDCHIY